MAKVPGRLASAFDAATPHSIARAVGDASTLQQLSAIERRAAETKAHFRKHYEKYVQVWVAAEAIALWKQRTDLSLGPVPDSKTAYSKEITANGFMAEARRNVYSRAVNRIAKVNSVKIRMSNAVLRNAQKTSLRSAFVRANRDTPSIKKNRRPTQ